MLPYLKNSSFEAANRPMKENGRLKPHSESDDPSEDVPKRQVLNRDPIALNMNNAFEKFVMDELRNLRSDLSAEIGYKYSINDKLQSGSVHVDKTEKNLEKLSTRIFSLHSEQSEVMRKMQDSIEATNLQMKRMETQMEEMQMNYSDNLHQTVLSMQQTQGTVIKNEIETVKSYLLKQIKSVEMTLSDALIDIHKTLQIDKDGMKCALQELRAVISAEINGRRNAISKLTLCNEELNKNYVIIKNDLNNCKVEMIKCLQDQFESANTKINSTCLDDEKLNDMKLEMLTLKTQLVQIAPNQTKLIAQISSLEKQIKYEVAKCTQQIEELKMNPNGKVGSTNEFNENCNARSDLLEYEIQNLKTLMRDTELNNKASMTYLLYKIENCQLNINQNTMDMIAIKGIHYFPCICS